MDDTGAWLAVVIDRSSPGQASSHRDEYREPEETALASSPVEVLESAISALDEREHRILASRTFANRPATLAAVGAQLGGLTRQRVAQVEARLLHDLQAVCRTGGLGSMNEALFSLLKPLQSIDSVIVQIPEVGTLVGLVDAHVGRILAALDERYEINDRWAARPDISTVQSLSLSAFRALAGPSGIVRLEDLMKYDSVLAGLPSRYVEEWVEFCGLEILEAFVINDTAGVQDRAAVVLESEGEPLHVRTVHARLGTERSLGTLKNALSKDGRFSRVNRESWALSAWKLPVYKSIRDSIGFELDRAGGQIGLRELTTRLTTTFDVSPQSVAIYAGAYPFSVVDGVVRRAQTDRSPGTSSPWDTARLFRGKEGWSLRVRITSEHLRGSSTAIPSSVADIVGVRRGTSTSLASSEGRQQISWVGPQPTIGSVRRLLHEVQEDDDVIFSFTDDGSFEIVAPGPARTGIDEILSPVGLTRCSGESPVATIARAIGLPPHASRAIVISALRRRRDYDIADLLEQF